PARHPEIQRQRDRRNNQPLRRHNTEHEDTTQVFYRGNDGNDPSSDEESGPINLSAPPPVMDDEDTSIDTLISNTSHDADTNPIAHNGLDERIVNEDEDDYIPSNIDLSRRLSVESHSSVRLPRLQQRGPGFERRLYEGSLDLGDGRADAPGPSRQRR
ncbi:hypothetical protein PMAYCL1PPCAC_04237, partial [Pristionchus mayeri]